MSEVETSLSRLGVSNEEIADIVKALFLGTGRGVVGIEQFVKRAQRLRAPLRRELFLER